MHSAFPGLDLDVLMRPEVREQFELRWMRAHW